MPLPAFKPTRQQINSYIARYQTIRGDTRPDGINVAKPVLGFLESEDEKWISAEKQNEIPAIVQAAGFFVYFVECVPGSGCAMHNHDSTETFIILEGTWKVLWDGESGVDHTILNKYDTMSFPEGVVRQFINIAADEGKTAGILLAIVEGNQPFAERCEDLHARQEQAHLQETSGGENSVEC